MDLSGRTPIYRLTKTPVPAPPPPPPQAQPRPPPVPNPQVNSQANSQSLQYQSPYHSPYQSPYTSSQSAPEDGAQAAPVPPIPPNPDSDAKGSPLTKRRGRKLQENEVLILINCCLEFQSMWIDNRPRFWFCVSTSLKRQIKRNFSWQSCRSITDELVAERRERRRDVAAGKCAEQPLTELRLATDKWIAVVDKLEARPEATPLALTFKRPAQPDYNESDPTGGKRSKYEQQTTTTPSMPQTPAVGQAMAPPPVVSPVMMDLQSLRLDLQGVRREMLDMRQELNRKLGLVMQALQEIKELNESKAK